MKTVGIGSLPHISINDACEYSIKHDMPFLPQMTSYGERMIPQALGNESLETKYIALNVFTEKILQKNIKLFKIQIAGPETCNVSYKIIFSQLMELIAFFKSHNLNPIIFIDEPVINNPLSELRSLLLELSNRQIITGLHSCAQFNWEQINSLPMKYLSYDLEIHNEIKETDKILIGGLPPYSNKKFYFKGEWISSSCGLAKFSETDCEEIFTRLREHK